ncbi:MAG: hypothetical protein KatS3mg057_0259 [Herpetosiphonaceae bacterium]|nr:MAG: hypothetical protein KatS3mg057_0259 [Herpetosiphonaceae bacterium]
MALVRHSVRRSFFLFRQQLQRWRQRIWFYPLAFLALAVLLFILTSLIDRVTNLLGGLPDNTLLDILIFGGSSDAARSILSAVATGFTTLAGVVFSITIVALQLAGNKFTSQLIPRFERDTITQITLGVYSGVITYSLLVLRTVRAPDATGGAFVPFLGVNLAIIWAIVAIFMTIVFISRVAQQMQPAALIKDVTEDGIAAYKRLAGALRHDWVYPVGKQVIDGIRQENGDGVDTFPATAREDGYVQSIDWDPLFKTIRAALDHIVADEQILVEIERSVDDTVTEEDRLGRVMLPAGKRDIGNNLASWVATTFEISHQRTVEHDPRYASEELVNIAIKSVQSGDVDVIIQCLKGLTSFYAAVSSYLYPQTVAISNDNRRALVVLPDQQLREHTLRGIERLFDQSLSQQYDAVLETLFIETGNLMTLFARRYHRALSDQQNDQKEAPEWKPPEMRAADAVESLEMLLGMLKKIYRLSVSHYSQMDELASATQRWTRRIEEAIAVDDRLSRCLLDFLGDCYEIAREHKQLVQVIYDGFMAIQRWAQEQGKRDVLDPIIAHHTTRLGYLEASRLVNGDLRRELGE